MRKNKRIIACILVIIASVFVCGANTPKLNIDDSPVYMKCNVEEIIEAANNDYKTISNEYKNVDIIDAGIVNSIEKNKKSLKVEFGSQEVTVKAVKEEVENLCEGCSVTVYGSFNFESEKKKIVSIKADHIVNEYVELKYDYYIFGGRRGYSDSQSTAISLADGRIEYKVPNDWLSTEATGYDKIFNSLIYSNNYGKCYYINRLVGAAEPEVFCVFYFDNNLFLEDSKDKDKSEDIEKEIINNICPDDVKNSKWDLTFPDETSISSKGIKFEHYVTDYDNYRVEFVFAPVKGKDESDNGGICVLLHLYIDDSIDTDDVLYVMSTLKVKQ